MFVRPTNGPLCFYQLINDLSGTNQYLTKESSAVNFVTVPKIQINISKSKNKIKIIFQVRMMYTPPLGQEQRKCYPKTSGSWDLISTI